MAFIKFFFRYEFYLPLAIVLTDLITKKIVKSTFNPGESKAVLGNFFRLTYIENPGIAFGIFSDISHESLVKNLIFTAVTLVASGFIIYLLRQAKNTVSRIALCFILGGALGNILERIFGHLFYFGELKIFYGKVVDFFDFGFGSYRWPFFNVADSFITIGVILLIIYSIFFENKTLKKKK